ncbi:MAG TPA: methyltransferase domain-containing protein [Jatrophihabitans sp.]|uniref:class I SAM-dependent methyltransferase n=1 Tax=Jatrophihabitans sp. TaxID=1932789 RepID=UPI002F011785
MASDAPDQTAEGVRLPASLAGDQSPGGRSPLLWASLRHILQDRQDDQSVAAPRVLDCGGGSGSLAVPLAVLGAVVTVVDVSIDALATLTRRAAEAGVSDRVTAVQGEAESLAQLATADTFDLVLAHDVLEDVQDPALVLGQIAGVLRPGGVLSVVVANPVAGVLARVLAGDVAGALAVYRQPVAQAYDGQSLAGLCLAAGLQVQSVEGLGVFTDLVPGIELDRPGAIAALSELESAVAGQPPYRDIASRLHVQASRPSAG